MGACLIALGLVVCVLSLRRCLREVREPEGDELYRETRRLHALILRKIESQGNDVAAARARIAEMEERLLDIQASEGELRRKSEPQPEPGEAQGEVDAR